MTRSSPWLAPRQAPQPPPWSVLRHRSGGRGRRGLLRLHGRRGGRRGSFLGCWGLDGRLARRSGLRSDGLRRRGLRRSRSGLPFGCLSGGLLLGLALGLFLGFAARAGLGLDAGLLLGLQAGAFLLGAEHGVPLRDDLADRLCDQRARADRVVVAGDHEVDPIRVAVGVDEADDRDAQALGLFHRDDLCFQVDHEHRLRHALHVLHAAKIRPQLGQVGLRCHALARWQQRQLALGLVAFEVVQATDALVDGLKVGQEAAQPAVVDVGHARRLGHIADGVACLLLGADEQDGPAAVGERAGELLRRSKQGGGLEQVNDVDAVTLTMDEAAHLWVPATRLVAEMDAGLQQLCDAYLSHRFTPFMYVR